jgi:bacterioferritin-associated ferredoxin
VLICSCKNVSERTVRAAIADGAASVEDVGRRCGAGTQCGGCHLLIEELLVQKVVLRTVSAA